jgi:hypothetical protein
MGACCFDDVRPFGTFYSFDAFFTPFLEKVKRLCLEAGL